MSLAKFFAIERIFDRSIVVIILAMGVVVAGATSMVGA